MGELVALLGSKTTGGDELTHSVRAIATCGHHVKCLPEQRCRLIKSQRLLPVLLYVPVSQRRSVQVSALFTVNLEPIPHTAAEAVRVELAQCREHCCCKLANR